MKNKTFIKAYLKNDLLVNLFVFYKLNQTDDWKIWCDNFGYKIIFDKKIKIVKSESLISDLFCKRNLEDFCDYNKIDYYNYKVIYNKSDIRLFDNSKQISLFNLSLNKIRKLFELINERIKDE